MAKQGKPFVQAVPASVNGVSRSQKTLPLGCRNAQPTAKPSKKKGVLAVLRESLRESGRPYRVVAQAVPFSFLGVLERFCVSSAKTCELQPGSQ